MTGRSNGRVRVSIAGGSGYVGGELMRLLLQHPGVDLHQVTSERNAGKPVRTLHPHLRGWCDLRFSSIGDLEPTDVLFLALPHGKSSRQIEHFASVAERIVDCAADFRLRDSGAYAATYGETHAAPEWLDRFVYGLPEADRESVRGARWVSGVGCNATASNLALLPFVRAGLVDTSKPVVVDLKVGSSEAGRGLNASGQHAERSGVVRSFAPTGHRHGAEVRQVTGLENVELTVSSVDLVRGALATVHLWTNEDVDDRTLWSVFRDTYGGEPFVRVVHDRSGAYRHPEPRLVAGTNHADVGWEVGASGRRVVALAAIDNLVKGAAGTAVQCMNLSLGLDEQAGLGAIGLHPH